MYKTPTIDFFVFSDYGGITKKLEKYYDDLDDGSVSLYKDYGRIRRGYDGLLDILIAEKLDESENKNYRTHITLEQMIPLKYFSANESKNINKRYKNHLHSNVRNEIIGSNIHFYYCLIEIKSNYFGEEYFPVLFSSTENWVLMEEVWKKQGILFDYVCGVCDGCRKGGAYKCVNIHYKDFLSIMKDKRKFWVSDHIHWEHFPTFNDYKSYFNKIATLKGWGNYNKDISYLYEIIQQ
ncbi:MAG: hypothetical protein U9P10_13015 [Thermodesulfobacteriota bacterium]|nr:hypothetical protein [Thermodesulfobacteriota bacterium]